MITVDAIRQMIAARADAVLRRVRSTVRRAVLTALDNSGGMAAGSFSITDDETDTADQVELINSPGVSYRPAAGGEAILLAVGGNAENYVALPFVRGQRLAGEDIDDGEVALYVGNAGQVVHLKADGSVLVRGAEVGGGDGGRIELKANGDVVAVPSATGKVLLGDGAATKKLALADEVDARLTAIQATFDAHVHAGVTVGPGSTAVTPTLINPLAPTGSTNVYGKG